MLTGNRPLLSSRRARIICTLGPKVNNDAVLEDLAASGMDVARLNLSFGTTDDHLEILQRLDRLDIPKRRPVATVVDIPGRKVRLGRLQEKAITLDVDQPMSFRPDDDGSSEGEIPVSPALFHKNLARGDRILLADGRIELTVTDFSDRRIETKVVRGGTVAEGTGVHALGMPRTEPVVGPRDKALLKALLTQKIDYVSVPDIADGDDLLTAKEVLAELGAPHVGIIAKIERPEAFARLDNVLKRADAVMVRRGDLGAEMEVSRVPLVQKDIVARARMAGVPVIIATQMLGSMVNSPRPTRAEASDVSNAVADGVDGVLLSSETAVGNYPVKATDMMSRIVLETEATAGRVPHLDEPTRLANFADATARIACEAATQTQARLLVCFTASGKTAKLVARHRPETPILVFCSDSDVRRHLALCWGIRTTALKSPPDVDEMVRTVDRQLRGFGLVEANDRIVIVFGAPVGERGHTNSVRLHEVGS